jgi:hypothetical protein
MILYLVQKFEQSASVKTVKRYSICTMDDKGTCMAWALLLPSHQSPKHAGTKDKSLKTRYYSCWSPEHPCLGYIYNYFTSTFVFDQYRRYNVTPTITFNQLLWWKAFYIIANELQSRKKMNSVAICLTSSSILTGLSYMIVCVLKGRQDGEWWRQATNTREWAEDRGADHGADVVCNTDK